MESESLITAEDIDSIRKSIIVKPNEIVVQTSVGPMVLRRRLCAGDLEAIEDSRDSDGDVQPVSLAVELALRLGDWTRTKLFNLGAEDIELVELAVDELLAESMSGTAEIPAGEDIEIQLHYPLRPQTDHEAKAHGEDKTDLPASVRWRPVKMGDLVRSESSGSHVEQTAKLVAEIVGIPFHRVIRMDLRDYLPLKDLAQNAKKKRSLGRTLALRTMLQGSAAAKS